MSQDARLNLLTVDRLKATYPRKNKTMITQELVDKINGLASDGVDGYTFMEKFLKHQSLLSNKAFDMPDYINAVQYVSYMAIGDSSIDAWIKTFPDRYEKLNARGIAKDAMNSRASEYSKNDIVIAIAEMSLVPSHILNAPVHQQSINVLTEIMLDTEVNPRDRVAAANNVALLTKQPEKVGVQVDVNVKNEAMEELNAILNQVTDKTIKELSSGSRTLDEVANERYEEAVIVEDGQ